MSTVSCIDHRDGGIHRGTKRCTFLWVAHGDNICIAADYPCRIGNGFALCSAGLFCSGKSQSLTAQAQHSRFKRKSGTGTWLIKQGSQLFAICNMCISRTVLTDPVCKVQNIIGFFQCKIQWIYQMSHNQAPLSRYSSRFAPTEIN